MKPRPYEAWTSTGTSSSDVGSIPLKIIDGPVGPAAADTRSRSLCTFLREQAATLLDWAIHAELDVLLASYSHPVDANGRPAVVRNGYLPQRPLLTNLGPVLIRLPRLRSRLTRPVAFRSWIARPYLRHAIARTAGAPVRFIDALGTGNLHAALAALMGPEAAALPAPVMQRLGRRWEDEHARWLTAPLARVDLADVWMTSLSCADEAIETLDAVTLVIGVDGTARMRMLAVQPGAGEGEDLLESLHRRGLALPVRREPAAGRQPASDETLTAAQD